MKIKMGKYITNGLVCLLIFIMYSCVNKVIVPPDYTEIEKTVTFSVMGDVPRSEDEKVILQEQIARQNEISRSEFVVHVGDIKSGKTPCTEYNYKIVANILKKLNVPLFIVPGDNEWNDCLTPQPDTAWSYWVKYFLNFEKNWRFSPQVYHQFNQPENFAFIVKGIVFIGINLVGGVIHDQDIWNLKMQNDAGWIKEQFKKKSDLSAAVVFAQANPDEKHELFISQFRRLAIEFYKPILFIHGDGHVWRHDSPWLEDNIIRVQVDKGSIADLLEISIHMSEEIKFIFDREPFKNVIISKLGKQ